MSRGKKILVALWLCLGLQFLFGALFAHGVFAGRSRYVPSGPGVASPTDAKKVDLSSPRNNDAEFVFGTCGELTRQSAGFLSARDTAEIYFQNCCAALMPYTVTLAPKASRCIIKSVLNL